MLISDKVLLYVNASQKKKNLLNLFQTSKITGNSESFRAPRSTLVQLE